MDDDRADRTLYVGNLDTEVTEDILYELFLQAGPLVSVKRIVGKPFAFVEFTHDVSVPYSKQIMTGTQLFGKELRLQFRSGSIHEQQRQPQNLQRSNSYPHPTHQGQQSFSPQHQQFQGQDPVRSMYYRQQQMCDNYNQYFQRDMEERDHNIDFRRSPHLHRTQSCNEQEDSRRGHTNYDGGRSRHHDRGQDDHYRNSGSNNRGHHMRNEPQELIEKKMRRSAESGMRHSSSRNSYQDSRSGGGHYYRR
ncbi:uncharacterized protein [Antedon mediterranea]|uniref:uncharacterized protein n=1 Tax=Antedon mediterranea TaxID=105859 RepID=UPI003AF4D5BA